MTEPVFDWFWQPPVDGKPGLCMVVDNHPGHGHPEIPFVSEALQDTLAHIEARIPKDLHLFQLGIYMRDVYKIWREVKVDPDRTLKTKAPYFSQADLGALWDSRQTGEEPAGP